MGLNPGERLGVYHIVSILGEGGMGQVYRARDSKLQRDVALKVLPDNVAGDPERVARFEREARTLAALNHPHIAQIYGTEQSGTAHALVMELVEGEDLAQRLTRGAIEWREAQPIARQIAEALEAAHEQGIVHRDLKPANIKLTADGVVKVLDFGLAKVLDASAGNREPGAADPAQSPTITSPAAITHGAVILGTAAYMSPEQAKGRPADKRSDVWAFGCVLYEMLTGKRAFPGDDMMETLAAVVRAEPDLAALPAGVPRGIRALLERCLTKDRRARVPEIAVVRYVLDSANLSSAPDHASGTRNPWPWAIATIAGIIAIATVAIPRLAAPRVEAVPVVRSTLAMPGAETTGFATIAVSQRGTMVAYASTQGRVMVRRLNDTEATPLQGTDGGANPFFSPDGEWLGFFADGKLKTISIEGGVAHDLADAPSGRGGTWGPDGTIVFAPAAQSGLSKVSANGGAVTVLTQVAANERSHRWPHLLPDGRHVLVTIQPVGQLYDDAIIATVPVGGGAPRTIVEGGSGPQFVHSGHLIYGRAGALMAVPFDPVTARATGAATPVIGNARTNALNGALPMGVSAQGLLVYLPGLNARASMTVITAERNGPGQVVLGGRMFNDTLRLSPDGRSLAVSSFEGQSDLWLIDLVSRGLRRLTSGAGSETFPVWSPDGSRLYYSSNTGGVTRTVTRAVDDSSPENDVTTTAFFPSSISPDGRALVGRAITTNSLDVVAVDVASGKFTAIVAGPANETEPSLSADGRYVAYQSDESGADEVFVQEFPSGSKWQVTTGGGSQPRWTMDGRELVYRRASTIYAVPVTHPFSVGAPRAVFSAPNIFAFDVTADGRRIVAVQGEESPDNPNLMLVSGWFEELRAKVRPAR